MSHLTIKRAFIMLVVSMFAFIGATHLMVAAEDTFWDDTPTHVQQPTNRWQAVQGTDFSFDKKSLRWCNGLYFNVDTLDGKCRIGKSCDMTTMTGCYSGLIWIQYPEKRKRVMFDCKNYFLDSNRNVAPESNDEKILDSVCINRKRFIQTEEF